MCMTFGYNPQINFCYFFHSLNLVIFGLNYYRSLWTLFEIKTIGGGIRVPWTLFLVFTIRLIALIHLLGFKIEFQGGASFVDHFVIYVS